MTGAAKLEPPKVNPWIVTCAVMLATFMEVLDTTVVNVSLPHISGNLSSSVDEGTWIVTSYLVSNAIVLPMSGWLAKYFGRRRMLLTCVIGFTVTSLACGFATSLEQLIIYRIFQGLTGGGMVPLAQSIMLESFPPEKHGKDMAAYSLGIIMAPVIGPTLGGWITDAYTWRWIFFINIPVGILSVLLMGRFVWDPAYLKRPKGRIDLWGMLLLALAFGSLQVVLDTGQKYDWFSSGFIRFFTYVCVFSMLAMLLRELTTEHPIVDLRALKDRTFAAGVFLITVVGFVLYGTLVLLPIYLQTLLGYPALQSGLAMSPRGVGSLVGTPFVGALTSRVDPRKILIFGLLLGGASTYQLSALNLNAGYWNIFWPQVLQGVSLSCLFIPLAATAISHIPKQKMGNATALFNLMRNIGGSLGIALMTTLIARRSQFHQNRLIEHVQLGDLKVQTFLHQSQLWFQSRGSDAYTASRQAVGALYGMVQRQAAMMSFVDAFFLVSVLFWAVIPFVFLLSNPRKRANEVVEKRSVPPTAQPRREAEAEPELLHV